ncbi:MAG: anti-sigma factor family protein [Opitutaceae bacterium]
MTCEEALKHLVAYLDRETDAHTAAEIQRHLEECRGCFSRAEFERKLKGYARDAGSSTAPERLRARIKEVIKKF